MKVQKKGVFWNLAGFLLLVAAMGLVLGSCELKVDNKVFEPSLTIFGKVVDGATLKGIGGATVAVKVNGEWVTTTTKSSTDITAGGEVIDNDTGDWIISGLPHETVSSPLAVVGPPVAEDGTGKAYVPIIGGPVSFTPDGGGNASLDVGTTYMNEGVTVTVYVAEDDTGSILQGTEDNPLLIMTEETLGLLDTSYGPGFGGFDATLLFAVADGDKSTLVVPKGGDTTVWVLEFDEDGDGYMDFFAANEGVSRFEKEQGAVTVILNVSKATGSFGIGTIKDSFNTDNNGDGSSPIQFLGETKPIWLYFNQPVTLFGESEGSRYEWKVTWNDSFSNLTAFPADTVYTDGDGITVKTDLGGYRLKITPDDDWTPNQTYAYQGFLRGFPQDDNTGTNTKQETFISGGFMVSYKGSDGIGETSPNITADNFNSCTNGANIGTGGSSTACSAGGDVFAAQIMFPEPVWGDIRLVSHVSEGGSSVTDNSALTSRCTTMNWYPALGSADGATDSIHSLGSNYGAVGCALNTGQPLADDRSGAANTVTVYVDVVDADGKTLTKQLDPLDVQ